MKVSQGLSMLYNLIQVANEPRYYNKFEKRLSSLDGIHHALVMAISMLGCDLGHG